MSSFCSTSANISLSNTLRTFFYSEFVLPLRTPSIRRQNRLSRHDFRSRRAITTVSLDAIPITSYQKTELPNPNQNEPSATIESSNTSNQSSNDQVSAQTTSSASSPSTRETKTESKTSSRKRADDRGTKKTTRKSATNAGLKPQKKAEEWEIQKGALKRKFPDGWAPPKKLSPDAMEGIRHLHLVDPDKFTTPVLAAEFKVSPEAIRRILKSKWRPSGAEMETRRQRWEKRHARIWGHMSELGLRPRRPDSIIDAATILYNKNKKDKGPSDS